MDNQTPPQYNPYIQPLQPVPNSTAVLVLGIISIPTCTCYGIVGLVCGIVALVLAKSGRREYFANPEIYLPSSYNNLKAGRVCAIIGTSLAGLYLIIVLIYILILGAAISTMPWDNIPNQHLHRL
jgi:hypothetical protein